MMGCGVWKWARRFGAVALACAWTAQAAWAAEGAAHGAGSGEGGILDPRFDLGIWTIIVFVVLMLVLRRFAWGPMLDGLKRREQNIRQALEDAQRAREDAEKVRSQLQAEMNQAADKVRQMLDDARRDAQYMSDEMVAKARAEIQGERERLRREIDTARDQALQQLWGQTAQLAALISSKAVRRQLNPEDHHRLVDEAITELREAGNNRPRQTAGVGT